MPLVISLCSLLLNPSVRDVSQCNLLFTAIYVYFLQFSVVCCFFCVFLQYDFQHQGPLLEDTHALSIDARFDAD